MKANPYFIDEENPEWMKEEFAKAKRGVDFFTPEQLVEFKQLAAKKTSRAISITLDSDVIDKFKALGSGWQNRMNDVLKAAKV